MAGPSTTARLDLSVWRNDDVYEFPLRVVGVDLSGDPGFALAMQVRLGPDTPGDPLVNLTKVTNGNAEGLRVAGVAIIDGAPVSDVRIRINKSTRQALPYAGEMGDSTPLAYALLIAGTTRLVGSFTVLAHTYGSDNAPSSRPAGYGATSTTLGVSSGATLTISQDGGATLVIDGAGLVEAAVERAVDAAQLAIASTVALNDSATITGDLFALVSKAGYIGKDGRVANADVNWQHTAAFIKVREGDIVRAFAVGHPAVTTISFYTEQTEDSFQDGVGGVAEGRTVSIAYPVPSDGYIRLCGASPTSPSASLAAGGSTASIDRQVAPGADLVPFATIAQFLKNNVPTADQNWLRSPAIPGRPGQRIIWSATTVAGMDVITFFQADGSPILPAVAGGALAGSTVFPAGARQAIISFANPATYPEPTVAPSFVIADEGSSLSNLLDVDAPAEIPAGASPVWNPATGRFRLQGGSGFASSDTIFLAGTSIMSTDYDDYRDLLTAATGARVINGGFSGYTPQQLATTACMQRIYDANAIATVLLLDGNHDGAAEAVGTIDGSNPGEPVCQLPDPSQPLRAGALMVECYAWIIQHWQAQYSDYRTRAGVQPGDSEATRIAKMDAILRPSLILDTGLPQQRDNAQSRWSQPANWERKARCAEEVANLFRIDLVDTMRRIGWAMRYEPFFPGVTDKANTLGNRTRDGLHPSRYGYADLVAINLPALLRARRAGRA